MHAVGTDLADRQLAAGTFRMVHRDFGVSICEFYNRDQKKKITQQMKTKGGILLTSYGNIYYQIFVVVVVVATLHMCQVDCCPFKTILIQCDQLQMKHIGMVLGKQKDVFISIDFDYMVLDVS
ncbi:hypothetical protein RFI_24170 [Reticulomyxa filosa]|uniref:Uncharacterized protein n=1 Tax=Reticulomyxa filosa TaxID=46433 RepID=X6MHQ7_RETFI|nr:hypothetical protein RFI_24170 [Reticulomyxa filosa]|eukprot:ETO13206.1 hypothetical protein RFI_24170 [Reticulomyxa filosa]